MGLERAVASFRREFCSHSAATSGPGCSGAGGPGGRVELRLLRRDVGEREPRPVRGAPLPPQADQSWARAGAGASAGGECAAPRLRRAVGGAEGAEAAPGLGRGSVGGEAGAWFITRGC